MHLLTHCCCLSLIRSNYLLKWSCAWLSTLLFALPLLIWARDKISLTLWKLAWHDRFGYSSFSLHSCTVTWLRVDRALRRSVKSALIIGISSDSKLYCALPLFPQLLCQWLIHPRGGGGGGLGRGLLNYQFNLKCIITVVGHYLLDVGLNVMI